MIVLRDNLYHWHFVHFVCFYFIIFGGGGWALMLSDQTDDTNDHNMKVSGSILAHE